MTDTKSTLCAAQINNPPTSTIKTAKFDSAATEHEEQSKNYNNRWKEMRIESSEKENSQLNQKEVENDGGNCHNTYQISVVDHGSKSQIERLKAQLVAQKKERLRKKS